MDHEINPFRHGWWDLVAGNTKIPTHVFSPHLITYSLIAITTLNKVGHLVDLQAIAVNNFHKPMSFVLSVSYSDLLITLPGIPFPNYLRLGKERLEK